MAETSKMPRVAMVTGAAGGIGKAICLELGASGAAIAAVDIDEAALKGLSADLAELGIDSLAIKCDVTSQAEVAAAVAATVARWGQIDCLCNNAGIASFGSVLSVEPDEWDRVMSVNVRSVYLFSRSALPHLLQSPNGAIVNIASDIGMVGAPERAAYCASKAAVINLSRQMSADFASAGVRVNAIAPGAVDTAWLSRAGLSAREIREAKSRLAKSVPMGRIASSREVAAVVGWLTSESASFTTGAVITVDGGASSTKYS